MILKNRDITILILTLTHWLTCLHFVSNHGMVMHPIARGSRWRVNESAPPNWEDTELFCGGMWNQFGRNGGKCGICGDNYVTARPRPHEIGGVFGEPVIVGSFKMSSVLQVKVNVTTNHKGKFWFDLCNMDVLWRRGAKMEEEECFSNKLLTVAGDEFWWLPSNETKIFDVDLRLPNMTCKHCVFRWTWMTGTLIPLI